jgi:hypothetical protein
MGSMELQSPKHIKRRRQTPEDGELGCSGHEVVAQYGRVLTRDQVPAEICQP